MKRREVMIAAAAAASFGLTGFRRRRDPDPLELNVWFSEEAATYDAVRPRIEHVLSAGFGGANRAIRIEFNDHPIALMSEEGATLMTRTWPGMVLKEAIGHGEIGEIGDVNLLVTDGDPSRKPAGYAMRSIATISGARYLARMTSHGDLPPVMDYSAPSAIAQLLLHECGHAVGLTHNHGSVTVRDNEVTATPMVGAYAWRNDRQTDETVLSGQNACGQSVSSAIEAGAKHRLALRYSRCARGTIRRYRGNPLD